MADYNRKGPRAHYNNDFIDNRRINIEWAIEAVIKFNENYSKRDSLTGRMFRPNATLINQMR